MGILVLELPPEAWPEDLGPGFQPGGVSRWMMGVQLIHVVGPETLGDNDSPLSDQTLPVGPVEGRDPVPDALVLLCGVLVPELLDVTPLVDHLEEYSAILQVINKGGDI